MPRGRKRGTAKPGGKGEPPKDGRTNLRLPLDVHDGLDEYVGGRGGKAFIAAAALTFFLDMPRSFQVVVEAWREKKMHGRELPEDMRDAMCYAMNRLVAEFCTKPDGASRIKLLSDEADATPSPHSHSR
jgi:hypothetical protein